MHWFCTLWWKVKVMGSIGTEQLFAVTLFGARQSGVGERNQLMWLLIVASQLTERGVSTWFAPRLPGTVVSRPSPRPGDCAARSSHT